MTLLRSIERVLVAVVDLVLLAYQKTLSFDHSFWGRRIPTRICRFHPSCSEYSRQAFACTGLLRGTALTLWRLARCQPFFEGGIDPVPAKFCRGEDAGPKCPHRHAARETCAEHGDVAAVGPPGPGTEATASSSAGAAASASVETPEAAPDPSPGVGLP